MSDRLGREIEAVVAARTERESVLMTSGRLALYCALVMFFSPGERLLMSMVTDDVIFFTVLAAGLRPVAAPLSPADGNLDVATISPSLWAQVDGVLTTNLYGLPDRMAALRKRCDEHGIPLIEDVAHGIANDADGRPLGTFGEAAAFSFSKHAGAGRGGALALADPALRGETERLRDRVVIPRSARTLGSEILGPPARSLARAARLESVARGARRSVHRPERTGHRMDLRPMELRAAIATAPALGPFDPWLRVDRHDYRMRPRTPHLERMLAGLRALPQDRELRIRGVERLRAECDLLAPGVIDGPAAPLFRVPVLVADREAAAAELALLGNDVNYVYDPPLDDYAGPGFATPSEAPEAAR
jgi:hypothetical protein